jgi:hypothetical protein
MKTILTLAVSGCLLSLNLCLGQNLLTNGSFELPGGIPDGSGIYLTSGDSRLTGWTVGGTGGPIVLHHGLSLPLIDFPPADGDYHLNFNAGDLSAGMWIAQSFWTTVGASYLVTCQVGKIGVTNGNVSLTASATSQTGEVLGQHACIPPPHGYGPVQSFSFTATTMLTTLQFLDTSADTVGVDVLLDNVSVVPLNCTPPPSGLVAWCPGDGNAVDVTSGGSGTVQNGASYAPGLVGQCFNFDGVNQWVSPPPGDLSNIRDNFTMEFWAYPTASRANTPETNSGVSGTSGQRYAIYPSPDPGGAAGVGV